MDKAGVDPDATVVCLLCKTRGHREKTRKQYDGAGSITAVRKLFSQLMVHADVKRVYVPQTYNNVKLHELSATMVILISFISSLNHSCCD